MKKLLIYLLIVFSFFSCKKYEYQEYFNIAENISIANDNTLFYPAFQNSIKHYVARNISENELLIKAQQNTDIYVNGRKYGTNEVQYNISDRKPDETLIITFKKENSLEAYYIHIVDDTIPQIQIEKNSDKVDDGHLLLSTNYKESNITYGMLFIVNNDGVPIYRKRIPNRVTDFKRHSNGMYSYAKRKTTINSFGRWNNEIIIMDKLLNEIESVEVKGLTHTDNHDFIITENSYILMSYHSNYRDLSSQGLSENELTRDSVIQEISRETGEVIFEWNSFDYLDLSDCLNHRFPDDYAHINSISLDIDNNIIASFRGCSMVLKINRISGDVMWSTGGSNPTLKIINDPYNEFCGQHTANVTPDGYLTIFDNGGHCNGDRESVNGKFSRALKYEIDIKNSRLIFNSQYLLNNSKNFYSISGGSFFELKNGNWLINWARGVNYPMTEIDPETMSVVFSIKTIKDNKLITNYKISRNYNTISLPIKVDDIEIQLEI